MSVIIGASLLVQVILGLISLLVFFLPTFVALKRDHPQKLPIILVNVILGGTLIGWVVAMVWALRGPAGPNPK